MVTHRPAGNGRRDSGVKSRNRDWRPGETPPRPCNAPPWGGAGSRRVETKPRARRACETEHAPAARPGARAVRRVAKAGDGDVRGELPSLAREARIRERASHPTRKRAECPNGRGSGPENPERPAGREMTHTVQGNAEWGGLHRRQRVRYTAARRSVDFADERKGQMDPFRAHPARTRQSELQLGDGLLQSSGQIEPYEESHNSFRLGRARDASANAPPAPAALRSDEGWAR